MADMNSKKQREGFMLFGELRLVPTIDPISDTLREEFTLSRDPEQGALAEGASHWERSLTSLGFIPLSLLTAPHALREVLRAHLDELSGGQGDDIYPLGGGHALFEGERLVLTHGCCSDLLNSLASWDNASQVHRRKALPYFDIGHNPDMFATWEDPWLVLNEADENAPCEIGDVVVVRQWRLLPQALEQAVNAARQEQEAFARRLEPYLAERSALEAVPGLAATLAGLR